MSSTDFTNSIYCRICVEVKNATVNLFERQTNCITMAEMVFCAIEYPIRKSDNLPSNICIECVDKLKTAYEFHNLVKASEEKFKRIISLEESAQVTENLPKSTTESVENIETRTESKSNQLECKQAEVSIPAERSSKKRCLIRKKQQKVNLPSCKPLQTKPKQIIERKTFECYKCKETFDVELHSLRIHMNKHKIATPNKCTICDMHFSAKNFDRHLCKGKIVQCEYCTESFRSTVSLLQHLDTHKDEIVLNLCNGTCCSKKFKMKSLLEWHSRHQHRVRPFTCNICKAKFNSKMYVHQHKENIHGNKCKY